MLIVKLPWCVRPWALPFMTILAPSKKCNEARGRQHKTAIDWAILAMRMISRWLKRSWVMIGDGGFACIRLGHACIKNNVTLISRLRLDAALYDFPVMPAKSQRGRRPEKGARSKSLKELSQDMTQSWIDAVIDWYGGEKKTVKLLSGINLWYSAGEKPLKIRWVIVLDSKDNTAEAFFSTDTEATPVQIIHWFVLRWNIEVTFFEMRAHLGMETQRQWSDKAIARSTPSLMALFSFICLFAKEMLKSQSLPVASTAWYNKKGRATFSDIIALVRRSIWAKKYFDDSASNADYVKIRPDLWESLIDQLARAG